MTPHRLALESFLCYGGRQELDLSEPGLCMLAGANGAGKSAVFDAVTFALFGAHRGGKQDHADLIHTGRDVAAVEFEFRLDGVLWKVRRVVRRRRAASGGKAAAAATHDVQLSRRCEPAGKWEAVAEAGGPRDFERWVARHVGLTNETFTCSVLLRQGRADRLLDADPRDRFAVLAGVVGLEHYQRLAERANDRRKRAAADADSLQRQIDEAGPPVGDDELARAAEDASAAGAAEAGAGRAVDSLQRLHAQATQWADLRTKLAAAEATRLQYGQLLNRGDRIDADWGRLSALRGVLPSLQRLLQQRRSLDDSRRRAEALAERRRTIEAELCDAARRLDELDKSCASSQQAQADAERRERELNEHRAALQRTLEAAEPWERQQTDLAEARREIAALPPDADAQLAAAQAGHDELSALALALPVLKRFNDHRAAQAVAAAELSQARQRHQANTAESRAAEARRAEARRLCDAAVITRQSARDHLTECAARAKADQQALAALRQTEGQADCPACGQPLAAEHRRLEAARRQQQLAASHARSREAESAWQAADADCRRLASALSDAEQHCAALAERGRAILSAGQCARRDHDQSAAECRRDYEQLPDPLRRRIAAALAPSPDTPGEGKGEGLLDADSTDPLPGDFTDWPATPWPAADDLSALAARAQSLGDARRRLAQAQQACQRRDELGRRVQYLADALAARPAHLPEDLSPLREQLPRAASDHAAAAAALEAARRNVEERQSHHRAARETHQRLARDADTLGRQCDQEQTLQQHIDNESRQAAAAVPPDWLAADPAAAAAVSTDAPADALAAHVAALQREADDLDASGAAADRRALDEARSLAMQLDARLSDLRGDIARLPSESHQGPSAVSEQLDAALRHRDERQSAHRGARRRLDHLQSTRTRRDDLMAHHREADRRRHRYARLSDLLGRHGLQAHLLRRAERAIVEYANQTLDRLSGGDLLLRLRPPADAGSDQALDLEALPTRSGTGGPIRVCMLSGSQKFRCAVALALAIGQYANGRHRAGEWVCIDEGFGSLDQTGQATMIQELHGLTRVLKKIILVSHQESFAGAFPEGYRFRIEDGETRVERVGA